MTLTDAPHIASPFAQAAIAAEDTGRRIRAIDNARATYEEACATYEAGAYVAYADISAIQAIADIMAKALREIQPALRLIDVGRTNFPVTPLYLAEYIADAFDGTLTAEAQSLFAAMLKHATAGA